MCILLLNVFAVILQVLPHMYLHTCGRILKTNNNNYLDNNFRYLLQVKRTGSRLQKYNIDKSTHTLAQQNSVRLPT